MPYAHEQHHQPHQTDLALVHPLVVARTTSPTQNARDAPLCEASSLPSAPERSTKVGGTFVHKAYDDSRLVSSKYLTAFSDLRSPAEAADHLSLPDYVKYLEQYCDEQRLWELITFGREVVRVTRERTGAGGALVYKVETRAAEAYPAGGVEAEADETSMRFDAVCVCSGLHEVRERL